MFVMENGYVIRNQRYDDVSRVFTCGDADLDDFFKNDSLHYTGHKLASTYIVEDSDDLLAYFSIANDRISVDCFDRSSAFSKFRKRFVNTKRIRGYPAVKICRLAVNDFLRKNGIGTEIINFLKATFHKRQRSACRFLTVDAYRSSVDFYRKNGFIPINDIIDSRKCTVSMYFDLADLDIQ